MRRCITAFWAIFCIVVNSWAVDSSVFILDYHTFIGSKSHSPLDFSPEEFTRHLDTFQKLGYTWVSLDDAIAGNITGKKNLVLTIDDGNHSVPEVVRSIIKPRDIPVTLFLCAALVLYDRLYFNPNVVKEMDQLGCTIGVHGYSHQYMTRKAFAENPGKVMKEIEKPGPIFYNMLGRKLPYFAYPYGVIQTEKEYLIKEAGYSHGFSASPKLEAVDFRSPTLNPYDIPRLIVSKANIQELFTQLEFAANSAMLAP